MLHSLLRENEALEISAALANGAQQRIP